MKRALALLTFLVATAAPALAVDTDAELVACVRQAVTKHKLADRPGCVDYVIKRKFKPFIDRVELREHHGGDCGGDPGTAPHLFNVIVDRQNHQMATDADDPADGRMKMLR